MRICHVIWSAHFGGIERLVLDICHEQQRQGLQPSVLFGRAHGEFLRFFVESNIPVASGDFSSGFDCSPGKIRKTRDHLRGVDIVHSHTFVTPLALAIAAARTPSVHTDHGNFGFGRKLGWNDHLKRRLYCHFLRRYVGHLTFNSDFTRRTWEKLSMVPSVSRSVVPNGLPFAERNGRTAPPAPDLADILSGSFVVGTASRFAQFKRIDRLIDGFAKFARNRNTRLLIVGDGPLRAEITARIASHGLTDKTIMTGFRPDAQACQQWMDVCVIASQNESFGLAAIETLGLGKPTVVFVDGGGMADIVTGISPEDVVPNEDALAARLAHYHDHQPLPPERARAIASAAATYDIRTTAASFLRIYQQLSRS